MIKKAEEKSNFNFYATLKIVYVKVTNGMCSFFRVSQI